MYVYIYIYTYIYIHIYIHIYIYTLFHHLIIRLESVKMRVWPNLTCQNNRCQHKNEDSTSKNGEVKATKMEIMPPRNLRLSITSSHDTNRNTVEISSRKGCVPKGELRNHWYHWFPLRSTLGRFGRWFQSFPKQGNLHGLQFQSREIAWSRGLFFSRWQVVSTHPTAKSSYWPHVGLSENRVYSQWNSHLIGIMISKTIGYNGVHYFQTHPCYFSRRRYMTHGFCPQISWATSSNTSSKHPGDLLLDLHRSVATRLPFGKRLQFAT